MGSGIKQINLLTQDLKATCGHLWIAHIVRPFLNNAFHTHLVATMVWTKRSIRLAALSKEKEIVRQGSRTTLSSFQELTSSLILSVVLLLSNIICIGPV